MGIKHPNPRSLSSVLNWIFLIHPRTKFLDTPLNRMEPQRSNAVRENYSQCGLFITVINNNIAFPQSLVSNLCPRNRRSKLLLVIIFTKPHSPSWEANRFSASQVISHILLDPKVNYRIQLSLSWASMNQSISPHTTSWKSLTVSYHLHLSLPIGLFTLVSPTQNPANASPIPIRATLPAHLFILNFIIPIILVPASLASKPEY